MGEYCYIVYEPTPMGEGIPIAMFSNMELASIFMASYFEKYYHEQKLAVKKVQVDGSCSLSTIFQRETEYSDEVV